MDGLVIAKPKRILQELRCVFYIRDLDLIELEPATLDSCLMQNVNSQGWWQLAKVKGLAEIFLEETSIAGTSHDGDV